MSSNRSTIHGCCASEAAGFVHEPDVYKRQAVVRAMRLTVDAAHRHGCEVGICGEFAGCAAHAELLVGLGFDELSVAPPSVPAVKERIRGLETPQAELTARRAVEAATASEVHELIGVG